MLRSNCKKALLNLRSYIINHSDFESYGMETPTDFKSCAEMLMHTFYEEIAKWDKRRIPYQQLFADWLSGLPSVFDSLYYYNRSAVDDLGGILEETETEKARFTEDEAERMLSALIWREVYKACGYQIK